MSSALAAPRAGQDAEALAGKRVVFLGDSITQAGGYVAFTTCYLEKLYPKKDFDVLGLGLASETLSGLSEDGHAGGKFQRPHREKSWPPATTHLPSAVAAAQQRKVNS